MQTYLYALCGCLEWAATDDAVLASTDGREKCRKCQGRVKYYIQSLDSDLSELAEERDENAEDNEMPMKAWMVMGFRDSIYARKMISIMGVGDIRPLGRHEATSVRNYLMASFL